MKDPLPKGEEKCPKCGGVAYWFATSGTDEPIYFCNRCKRQFKVDQKKQSDLVSDFGFPDVPKQLKIGGKKK